MPVAPQPQCVVHMLQPDTQTLELAKVRRRMLGIRNHLAEAIKIRPDILEVGLVSPRCENRGVHAKSNAMEYSHGKATRMSLPPIR